METLFLKYSQKEKNAGRVTEGKVIRPSFASGAANPASWMMRNGVIVSASMTMRQGSVLEEAHNVVVRADRNIVVPIRGQGDTSCS